MSGFEPKRASECSGLRAVFGTTSELLKLRAASPLRSLETLCRVLAAPRYWVGDGSCTFDLRIAEHRTSHRPVGFGV